MGDTTPISWTDKTFNPWWGCARVSRACDGCYAEQLAKRWGHDIWGRTGPRWMMGDNYWRQPVKWNRQAAAAGQPLRVFCASMADILERHPVPEISAQLDAARTRLWGLIEQTPWLTWMLLTKRPENYLGMTPWGSDWPVNVWPGVTTESQEWADERIPYLQALPVHEDAVRFVSAEPLTSALDLSPYLAGPTPVGWVITGGESGSAAKPSHPFWFSNTQAQAQAAGVPFHHKQWGEWSPDWHPDWPIGDTERNPQRHTWVNYDTGKTKPYDEIEDHEIDSWRWHPMCRVGHKVAGRALGGRVFDEFPPMPIPVPQH